MEGDLKHEILLTLTVTMAVGIGLMAVARRTGVPAIVLLLAGGVLLGPEGLGCVRPASLEGVLPALVALAVGLILFEGGLTLDLRGYTSTSRVIQRLLTLGVLVTWLGTAAAAWFLLGTSLLNSLLMGSMVIVTGPTVIVPLLRRIRLESHTHTILHWEAILIDAVGVFIAILCFDLVLGALGSSALAAFSERVLTGALVGLAGGFLTAAALKSRAVPDRMAGAFTLGMAAGVFGAGEAVISESGLLAVVVAGLVVGWRQPEDLKRIREFKEEMTDLLIAVLFVLLSARLELDKFYEFGWRGMALVGIVMLVVRPLNILLATWGSDLDWRRKAFLSWVAPRGIVAASMASLFALRLAEAGDPAQARLLEVFVYSVIVATVVLQGFTAEALARALGLQQPKPDGWLIVGAHALGRQLARLLAKEAKAPVLLIDTNNRLVQEAREEGLAAVNENAGNTALVEDNPQFQSIGHVLALTDNPELNSLICLRWSEVVGRGRTFRWAVTRTHLPHSREGAVILASLGRPSVVAAELASSESHAERIEVGEEPPPAEALLIGFRKNQVLFPEEAPPLKGDVWWLVRRPAGILWRGIEVGGIKDGHASDLRDLMEQLAARLVKTCPAVNREWAVAELVNREERMPTYLGHGISVPHLFVPGLERRICHGLRLRQPLPLAHGESLSLVFFLASPPGDPESHLEALAEVARLVSDAGTRQELHAAPDAAAMRDVLREKLTRPDQL